MWFSAYFVITTILKCKQSFNNQVAAYALFLRWMEKLLQTAAGSVSRHLPSLHVDPSICRLVRWLSHVWLSSSLPDFCHLPGRTSGGSADASALHPHISSVSDLWYLQKWISLYHFWINKRVSPDDYPAVGTKGTVRSATGRNDFFFPGQAVCDSLSPGIIDADKEHSKKPQLKSNISVGTWK